MEEKDVLSSFVLSCTHSPHLLPLSLLTLLVCVCVRVCVCVCVCVCVFFVSVDDTAFVGDDAAGFRNTTYPWMSPQPESFSSEQLTRLCRLGVYQFNRNVRKGEEGLNFCCFAFPPF